MKSMKLLFIIFSALFGVVGPSFSEQPSKPNIIFLLSDDQAWTDYGFMGHPDIQTPHLDKLSEEGLLFRRG